MMGAKQTHRKLLINHAVLRREMQTASDAAQQAQKAPLKKCHLRKPRRMSSSQAEGG